MKKQKSMQQASKENKTFDTVAFGGGERVRDPEYGIGEIELLELYWEDFSETEWDGNVGRGSRKPSLDDYDRWLH